VIAMKTLVLGLLGLSVSVSTARCWDWTQEWEASQYIQRSDTITLSAGNAKDVNAATHVIDPWPRYVGRRRIPANGERMVGAMQRYLGRQRGGQNGNGGAAAGVPISSDTMSFGSSAPPPAGAALPSLR
jgi:hypothetical protein